MFACAACSLGFALTIAASSAHAGSGAAAKPPASMKLIKECTAALTRAHPWRARQLQSAMVGLRLSMSYRVAADQLSPQERRAAAANERLRYERLAETCQPLLS